MDSSFRANLVPDEWRIWRLAGNLDQAYRVDLARRTGADVARIRFIIAQCKRGGIHAGNRSGTAEGRNPSSVRKAAHSSR